ncbi:MAG: M15 family metallopeptidase [Defluviitaleaceae bacterium]|nr:M15 family metallopeptidase [Defluviitaleaceae bacterium]
MRKNHMNHNARSNHVRRNTRNKGNFACTLIVLAAAILCGAGVLYALADIETRGVSPLSFTESIFASELNALESSTSNSSTSNSSTADSDGTSNNGLALTGSGFASVRLENITDTGKLALVNREFAFAGAPAVVPVWPTVPVMFVDGMDLHPSALAAIADMFESAGRADAGSLFVSSGFRGANTQAVLYDNGANAAFALPPGHSEHHTGLAADILITGVSQAEMANSPGGRWLAENSYRYGLILRYPQGATHITGIEFEPWHFRYVGRPHAYFMHRNNLVLEEYIELIRDTGGFDFEMNGRTYHILHQFPRNGAIYLPTRLRYTVSGDNTGGFIVTAQE